MKNDLKIVERNYKRYLYAKDAHQVYVGKAIRNENFYWGDGGQWKEKDRKALESVGRFVAEFNQVQGTVDTIVGMQLQNRVDMSFKPRNVGGDEEKAEVLTKVIMQLCDDIKYQYKESQAYEDGRIEQRGFLEFRMDFDENFRGDIVLDALDPRDCLPDPDATSYYPKDWGDFIKLRWMSFDDIEGEYGKKKADEVRLRSGENNTDEDKLDRNSFGDNAINYTQDDYTDNGIRMYLVIDRQWKRRNVVEIAYYSKSGDEFVADDMPPEERARHEAAGAIFTKKAKKRIRWTVTCGDVLLHDDWSPYRTYTVIPYFPKFRRGRTQGDVDNLISPQETYNKSISQFVNIVNSAANSGWIFEQDSLVDMTKHDLADHGASTGLVLEVVKGAEKPQKIEPNKVPTGLDRMIDRSAVAIKEISGVDNAQRGANSNERSGVAVEGLQFAGGAQRARSNDNLALTRELSAQKLVELVKDFYTEERVFTITDSSDPSRVKYEQVAINQVTPEGAILNDFTVGEYDVVVTEMPTQATFMDSQFKQAREMRKDMGINIPDARIIEMSSLTKKHDIIKEMSETNEPPPDPKLQAEAERAMAQARLADANVEKVKAETVSTRIESQYSAIQTAGVIAATPQTAPLGDELMGSAGYVDSNQAPIMPNYVGPGAEQGLTGIDLSGQAELPPNTNPTTPVPVPLPPDPTTGVRRGIETQRIEGDRPWQRLAQ